MRSEDYNILTETYCFYCQKVYATANNLQRHVLKYHPGTYADLNIREAKDEE